MAIFPSIYPLNNSFVTSKIPLYICYTNKLRNTQQPFLEAEKLTLPNTISATKDVLHSPSSPHPNVAKSLRRRDIP